LKKVTVLTADARLRREIALLLPNEYTLSDHAEEGILIVDADSVELPSNGRAYLLIFRNAPPVARANAILLQRPFSISAFQNALIRLPKQETAISLTPTEQKLLDALKAADGKPISRAELLEKVWGDSGSEGLLNLYVHYLREKLEKDGVRRIFATRGKGYYYKC